MIWRCSRFAENPKDRENCENTAPHRETVINRTLLIQTHFGENISREKSDSHLGATWKIIFGRFYQKSNSEKKKILLERNYLVQRGINRETITTDTSCTVTQLANHSSNVALFSFIFDCIYRILDFTAPSGSRSRVGRIGRLQCPLIAFNLQL